MNAPPTRFVLTAILLLLLLPQVLVAQSASEILGTALERHEQRMANIDNYTVVQTVNGIRAPAYFEKVVRDGRSVFEPRSIGDSDISAIPGGEEHQQMGGADILARLGDRGRVMGTESVGGRSAWVLRIDDASGLGMDSDDFAPTSMTIHLDQQDYVPLRMVLTGQMMAQGESHEITMTTRMQDYREVQGLLHPFRSSISIEGMGGAMSADGNADMRKQVEEMQKQMENMPAEQRRMIEEQLENMPEMRQMMEQMEAMAAGEAVEMTVEVEEVQVNQGPPS